MLVLKRFVWAVGFISILLASSLSFGLEKGEERFYIAAKAFSDGFYDASLSLFQKFIQDSPASALGPEARMYAAKCYFHLGDYPKSLELLTGLEATKDFHDLEEEVYYWFSTIYFKGKDFKKSLHYSDKIIKDFPQSQFLWWAQNISADNNVELGNYEQAALTYTRIIRESQDQRLIDDAYSKLLSAQFYAKKYSSTIELAREYLDKYPKGEMRAKAQFYAAESHHNRDEYQDALAYYKYALSSNPSGGLKDLIFQGLGFTYIAQNNHLEAKRAIDSISDQELRFFSQGVFYLKTKSYIEALETFDIFLRNYPKSKLSAAVHLNKGDLLYEMGRVNDAISVYQAIIDNYKSSEHSKTVNKARYGLAWCHLKNGKFKEAVEGFERTLEQADSIVVKISSQIQIADTHQETGSYDKALDMYNQILKQYPNTIYADYIQFQIGVALLKKKDLGASTLALRNLKRNFPQSKLIPQAHYYLAVSYFTQGDYSQARDLLEDFMEEFPADDFMAKVYYLYGKTFYNEGRYQQAIDNFKTAITKFKDKSIEEFVHIDIGNAYFNLPDLVKAKKTWSDFLSNFPNSEYRGSVALYLGGVHEKEKDYIGAEKYYRKVMSEFGQTAWGYEAMLSLGHLYWSMNNLDAAEKYFKDLSVKNTPLAIKGKLYLAEVLVQKGQESQALSLYDQLINSESSVSKIALVNKAALFRQLQEYGQAAVLYKKAIDDGLNTADIVFFLALCYEKSGNDEAALENYFKIIYSFPSTASQGDSEDFTSYQIRAYFRIARIYEKQMKIEDAKLIYQKIVDMNVKESHIAQTRLKELGAVRR